MRYRHLFLTDDQIRHSLRMQVIAHWQPERIRLPKGFAPRGPVDRRILDILKPETRNPTPGAQRP